MGYFYEPIQVNPELSQYSTMLGGASKSTASMDSAMGPILGVIGALQSGLGAYYSAQSVKSNLEFQADMSAINARMAEKTAQSILMAGEQEQGKISLRAGKVKSSQRASMAARGIALDSKNAVEEIATTDLMKETDMFTINANAVRQAWAARTQGVNAANEGLLKGTSADSVSPFTAASTSLINSGATVASSWYRNRRADALLEALSRSKGVA